MNDRELDELLNTWKAPAPRESLREAVRAGIEPKRWRPGRPLFTRWRLASVAAVVILAFTLASPNVLWRARPAFTVDSKVTYYVPFGAPPWYPAVLPESPLVTSYNDEGSEVILSWSSPEHPFQTLLWKVRLAISSEYDWLTGEFVSAIERLDRRVVLYEENGDEFASVYPSNVASGFIVGRRSALLSSGCRTSQGGAEVIGEEVILNYPTTIVQQENGGGRILLTLWMAPELSCFALRATINEKQPDGTWKLASEKKALKVTVNH